jgi:hypothetical protein
VVKALQVISDWCCGYWLMQAAKDQNDYLESVVKLITTSDTPRAASAHLIEFVYYAAGVSYFVVL